MPIKTIIKRDGRIVDFDYRKIGEAIFKAALAVGGKDKERAMFLAKKVIQELEKENNNQPTVEQVQDKVEKVLIEEGHAKTAKAYILYRHKKNSERQQRALILGEKYSESKLNFSARALKVLERRYLRKDKDGNLIETPQEMLERVAKNVAQADPVVEKKFYEEMSNLRFLPNSPTLINAGTKTQQLSACFVLPIEDNMESIFTTLKSAAIIHQRGGGTGFSFSRLRPKADPVKEHMGVSAGPVTFMQVYYSALDVIKQGGVRPGANMAVLRVDHPDIIRFIESKRDKNTLKNFNLSVGITDQFMKQVEEDKDYELINPRTGRPVGKLRAKDVFSLIIHNSWKTGDPGILFLDEINRKHPGKHLGEIETTNQCGEVPLLPYESCALGSINLNKLIRKKEIDWQKLKETVYTAIHFLDNVIDINVYPDKMIEDATKRTRKIGLGIMGLADVFFKLRIKYDSDEGLEMAEKIISTIKEAAYQRSEILAKEKGLPPGWEGSDHKINRMLMRNLTCLSIAPTGTISILADASSGCEPLFALSYQQTFLGDNEFIYINPEFEEAARTEGFYSPELIRKISNTGSIKNMEEIPKHIRDVFVTSQDISPEWHIKMQSVLQKHIDNSISKTINFPRNATLRDVELAYFTAWKEKCKGITIYRDGSYPDQVINIGDN